MIVCVDVAYADDTAFAAGVFFDGWSAATPSHERVVRVDGIEPYLPGQFFRRELPPILALVAVAPGPPSTVVIDGYVWLAPDHPGLGAHLFDAVGGSVAVVGVAKTKFGDASAAAPLLRGTSATPLYVTAAGVALDDAVAHVRAMHGAHRIPTLIRRADRLCRDAAAAKGC